MSVDHRHLWSTPFVLQHLRTGGLSEAAAFTYFLVIMTFDWLQFTGTRGGFGWLDSVAHSLSGRLADG